MSGNSNELEIYATIEGRVMLKNGTFAMTLDPDEADRAALFLQGAAEQGRAIAKVLPEMPAGLPDEAQKAWIETRMQPCLSA